MEYPQVEYMLLMIFPQGDEPASGEISVTCQSDSDCGEHGNCHEFAVHGQTVEGVNFPSSVSKCASPRMDGSPPIRPNLAGTQRGADELPSSSAFFLM